MIRQRVPAGESIDQIIDDANGARKELMKLESIKELQDSWNESIGYSAITTPKFHKLFRRAKKLVCRVPPHTNKNIFVKDSISRGPEYYEDKRARGTKTMTKMNKKWKAILKCEPTHKGKRFPVIIMKIVVLKWLKRDIQRANAETNEKQRKYQEKKAAQEQFRALKAKSSIWIGVKTCHPEGTSLLFKVYEERQ